MDRVLIKEHLDLAERHVAQGVKHIIRQRKIIAELERDGHDSSLAIALLTTFKQSQAFHVADRDRLKSEFYEKLISP